MLACGVNFILDGIANVSLLRVRPSFAFGLATRTGVALARSDVAQHPVRLHLDIATTTALMLLEAARVLWERYRLRRPLGGLPGATACARV